MDKTEKYIKMCGKAVKLQEDWRREREASTETDGGFWFTPNCDLYQQHYHDKLKPEGKELALRKGEVVCSGHLQGFAVLGSCDWCGELRDFSLVTWLPTQAQLQAMIAHRGINGWIGQQVWLWRLTDDSDAKNDAYWVQFKTWEQVWLAALMTMDKKYWTGEDWEEAS